MFTSPSGVELFFEFMKEERIDIRALGSLRFAVIGEGTRKSLETYGFYADYMPGRYYAEDLGEGLAAFIAKEKEQGSTASETVLLLRARKASKALTEKLKEVGIDFEERVLYDTETADVSPQAERVKNLLSKKAFSFVTFTSASTVEGFLNMLNPSEEEKEGFTAVCIGEQTRQAAEAAGMRTVVSAIPSMDSMAERMEELCRH